MSGIQEILVVLVIILILFYLPRRAGSDQAAKKRSTLEAFSGKLRLAVLLSLIWLACAAYFLEPWQNAVFPFLYVGVGPVILGWGIGWVVFGFRKHS